MTCSQTIFILLCVLSHAIVFSFLENHSILKFKDIVILTKLYNILETKK